MLPSYTRDQESYVDFIVGPEIQNHVIRLIAEAEKVVVLVTPYFQPWGHLRMAIENARVKGVEVVLILRGGDKLKENTETAAYFVQRGVKVLYLERLHAKLYLTEKAALLTSMNLVEASATGSWEIAAAVTRASDEEAYKKLAKCWLDLQEQVKLASGRAALAHATRPPVTSGTLAKPTRSEVTPPRPVRAAAGATTKGSKGGHCIRCGDAIPSNPERPLCKECYGAWADYENDDYPEKYCHTCGKKAATTMAKPECRPCYAAS